MGTGLQEFAEALLLTVGTLFPIVNPLGNAPIFLSLTRGFSTPTRCLLSRRIALNGFVLLVVSMLIGSHILAFFGISIPVVQVGGGLVVISAGWTLLQQKDEDVQVESSGGESLDPKDLATRAFYPLTLPLTVGPGSISVAITLGANLAGRPLGWPVLVSALVGPALMAVTIYLSYRFAERIAHLIGETAMNVLIRLSSFILLCIGVQILWNGVIALLATTPWGTRLH